MRRLFLSDAAAGDSLEDVFVISGKQLSATRDNKYYIKAFLSDRTCQMPIRMWNATKEIFAELPDAGFVRIRGWVENYQNNLQIRVEQAWPAKDGTFDHEDLLPHTTKDVNQMCARLQELCGSIQNRHLAALVQAYIDDEKLMDCFCKAPAAMSFHHAFLGGLLEHTLNAMEVGNCIVQFYPGLNRDLLLAGIFLHDIAKTWELKYESAFGYTDSGQLVGHIVKSAIWVEEKAREAEKTLGEKIPQDLVDVLQHIIISHHGTPEHGAVKVPGTPEALAVHMIENMDAKLMIALGYCRADASTSDGNWTEYIKAFGVRLYRPDVAPAEATDGGDAGAPEVKPPIAGQDGRDGQEQKVVEAIPLLNNPLFETVRKG